MGFKEKAIGFVLIIMGALPLLLKIESVNNAIGKYGIIPGNYIYQAVLVIFGLLLLFKFKPRAPLSVMPSQK